MSNFIDLFSGCGGFSLGLQQAGHKELAAIDFDKSAIKTFAHNLSEVKFALEKDLTKFLPADLEATIKTREVDFIIGGPPCQGFSRARQRDGSNNGPRLIPDSRRELYKYYFRYVSHFRPKAFVMENVLGIRSAAGGHYLREAKKRGIALGYSVTEFIIRAWQFGVPQKRVRQLLIGIRVDLPNFSVDSFIKPTHYYLKPEPGLQKFVSLWEAIGDLPSLRPGSGVGSYDARKFNSQINQYGKRYLRDVMEINTDNELDSHFARPQSQRDLRDFRRLREGETGSQAIARGQNMEYPYDRNSFSDRFTRLEKSDLATTIVAHMSKDGLRYIHPTQTRTLTPREAARIQSFPDWFEFPVSRTHAFQLIGNAFPPLAARAVGNGLRQWISFIENQLSRSKRKLKAEKHSHAH